MPRSLIDVSRAFIVVYKGNGEIVSRYPEYFTTPNTLTVYPKPSIIRILRYVNIEYRNVPLTKNNIFKRDDYRCVYCGVNDKRKLTIDHVIPKCRNGNDTWDNVVVACNKCNNEKGNLTLEEWGKEDPNPRKPHFLMLLKKSPKRVPEEWKKFLFF